MKQLGTAVENFFFKSFDLTGRATLLEYWLMMPLVWLFIIFLFVGDVTEFWGFLLAREVPPLNPLYWDSLLVFVLTMIPRYTLTVRRLHDSGKRGKWAGLPFLTLTSGTTLTVCLAVAFAATNMSQSGMSGDEIGIAGGIAAAGVLSFIWAMFNAPAEVIWQGAFASAAMVNAIGLDAIIAMASELFAPPSNETLARGLANASENAQAPSADGALMMILLTSVVATPFVAGFLHIFFMISPSKPDHELDNTGPISGSSLRRRADVSDNPFAGYKYLYPKTAEQEAAAKAKAKQDIKSLYQERVLRGGQPI